MSFETAFVALFTVATVVALLARRLKLPYTVALVVAGLVLGAAHVLTPPLLTKDLLYSVFLPGLLFEAAFALEFGRFWNDKAVIVGLALPGVVAIMVLTAALLLPALHALHLVEAFSFEHGMVFGVIIAATDPIAVVATFKNLKAPERLTVLVEGESLLNDGTTVVFFSLIVGVVGGNGRASVLGIAFDFVRIVGLGILVGSAIAFAASKLVARVRDPMIEMMLTTVAAYASFVVAEQLHSSGVIATVIAGMLCGSATARSGLSSEGRVAVQVTWEYLAFALNSVLFLLIGFQVQIRDLLDSWQAILAAYVAVTLGRAIVVYAVTALGSRGARPIPWSWSAALTWGGLRGGLSMVLVLGLPADFPHRALLVAMTFGVVLISILLQGLTMSPLLRWLRIVEPQRAAAG